MTHIRQLTKPQWILLTMAVLFLSSAVTARERINPFSQPNYMTASSSSVNTASTTPSLKLKAVMPRGPDGVANIDGHMLRIGETYEGFELIEVTRQGARLRRGEQILDLELRPQIASALRNNQ